MAMDGSNNPNNNRLFLNFGSNNERLAPSDRTYPTTPSTFPQPVFSSLGGQSQQQQPQPQAGMQSSQQQPQPNYQSQFAAPSGYFMQNQYQSQYSAQQPMSDYSAQSQQYQPRSNTPGTNDPNVGLAHQFSHQNLGGAARASPYGSRGPSPSQRPRTAGATGQAAGYSNYMNVPMPTPSPVPVNEFDRAPERNPDKFGPNSNNNQKKCSQLAADFFKDSVKRARERNQRYENRVGMSSRLEDTVLT
jgi:protein-serine/threonine kinase